MLIEDLTKLLKENPRFIDSNGNLLKNLIIEIALKLDYEIINLLLKEKNIRDYFFKEYGDFLIFDKDKFIKFISNKKFLPDSYTSFKNKIGLANEENKFLSQSKEVVLVWPYKDCIFEGTDENKIFKKQEIFHNVILAPDDIDRLLEPKVFTKFTRISGDEETPVNEFCREYNSNKNAISKNNLIRENLVIKGNNLIVLSSLLEVYKKQVKLIYIDPPYNTGGGLDTFTYNNNFNHSTWLTFMKNRLEIAKKFLREDGFIVVAIDHNELFYLGVLMDEIFGKNNRIGVISVLSNPMGRQYARFFSVTNDFMLVYALNAEIASFNKVVLSEKKQNEFNLKDDKGRYKLNPFLHDHKKGSRNIKPNNWYPIYVSPDLKNISLKFKKNYIEILPISDKGIERSWMTIPETTEEKIKQGDLVALKDENGKIKLYYKYREYERITTFWDDRKYNSNHYGSRLLKKITGKIDFSYPKSLYTLTDVIKLMTDKNDIVLDFFAGSGTTAHAALMVNKNDRGNRKFILIEQLDRHLDVCIKRLKNVIKKEFVNDNFIYMEPKKLNETFIEKIEIVKTTEELLYIWNDMKKNGFLSYKINPSLFEENLNDFKNLDIISQKKLLLEILEYNYLYLNYSDIDDPIYNINELDKKLNHNFYKNE